MSINAVYRSSVLDIAAIDNIGKAALLGCQRSDKVPKPHLRHLYMLHNQVTCNGKAAASSCLDVGQRQAMTAALLTIPAYPQLVGTGVCVVPTGLPTAPYPSERLPLPEQSLPPALHCSCLSLSGNCDQTWRCILQRPFMSPSQCNAAYMI